MTYIKKKKNASKYSPLWETKSFNFVFLCLNKIEKIKIKAKTSKQYGAIDS